MNLSPPGNGITYTVGGTDKNTLTIHNGNSSIKKAIPSNAIRVLNNGTTANFTETTIIPPVWDGATITASGVTYNVNVVDDTAFANLLCSTSSDYTFQIVGGGEQVVPKTLVTSIAFIYDGLLTSIVDNFLSGCTSLNCDIIIPTTCLAIGHNFLYGGENFNGNVVLPSSLTSIGVAFLRGCPFFNSDITIPTSCLTIDDEFLYGAERFNGNVTLPSSMTNIGQDFMYGCKAFNKPISIPGIYQIRSRFMKGCDTFNSTITLNTGTHEIGMQFLMPIGANTSFNQPIVIPNTVTTIRDNFLSGCTLFNQPITLSNTLTHIQHSFLYGCTAFDQDITIPNGMVSIASDSSGRGFLQNCDSMTHTVDFGSNSDGIFGGAYKQYHMSSTNQSASCVTSGIKITGTYAYEIHLALPDSATSVPCRKLVEV